MKINRKVALISASVLLVLFLVSMVSIYLLSRRSADSIAPTDSSAADIVPAFPTAMGFGKDSLGGRGGKIIKVTNLNKDGAGSLKAAVDTSGPRIVIFDVGGVIDLDSTLEIHNDRITIAGQTAPPPGITLKGHGLKLKANDVVIRHIAVRPGDHKNYEGDSIQLSEGNRRIILDHVSMSFATDETFSIHNSESHEVTLQNSIIAFPLNCSVHEKGCHGYNFLISGDSKKVSLIYNLSGFGTGRHPRIQEKTEIEVIGNYFLQIKDKCMLSEDPKLNLINNIYEQARFCDDICDWQAGKIYASGNTCNGASNNEVESKFRADSPTFQSSGDYNKTGNSLKNYLLDNAGKTKPNRDGIDREIITRFRNKSTQIIDTPGELNGGFALLNHGPTQTTRVDSDNDGMPNDHEDRVGLNKNDPADASIRAENGYTNIENYINHIGGDKIDLPGFCTPVCSGKECGSDGCGGSCGSCQSGQTCSNGECKSECQPSCSGKECGDDGCGGSCGNCTSPETCQSGQCKEPCTPQCSGKECGSDGCGGQCGTCDANEKCENNQCVDDDNDCTPNCTGKVCGSDGCGGTCGTCESDQRCENSQCVDGGGDCTPNCSGKECGPDGCGGACGSCSAGQTCQAGQCENTGGGDDCTPNCTGKECGDDGCGGSCGTCNSGYTCNNVFECEQSNECQPQCSGKECGSDGCGGTCGTCGTDQHCNNSVCEDICVKDCGGKQCGSDGCGGICGTCSSSEECRGGICYLATPQTCTPSCTNKQCGSDGCGGSCGTCKSTEYCSNYVCYLNTSGDQGKDDNNGDYNYDQTGKDLPDTDDSDYYPFVIGIAFISIAVMIFFIPQKLKPGRKGKMVID